MRVGGAGDIGNLAAECKFCLKKINFNAIIAANNENGGQPFQNKKRMPLRITYSFRFITFRIYARGYG